MTDQQINIQTEKKESALDKMKRIHREEEERERQAIEQQRLEREHKIKNVIIPYLESVDEQISGEKLWTFWSWPDRKGFKKINKISHDEMKKIVKSDEKYYDRTIVHFRLYTGHDNEYAVADDKWMAIIMVVFHIDEKGNLENKKDPSWGCKVIWEYDDFKISKLSFKLIERLMHIVASKKHTCSSLAGYRLEKVVAALKKKKIDISDCLQPLAGM